MSLVGSTRRWVVLAPLAAWVPVDARSAPASLLHRVAMERGSGDSARTAEIEGPPVPMTADAMVIGGGVRVPSARA